MTHVEVWRFAHRAALRKLELDTAKGREALVGEFCQIPRTGLPVAHGLAQYDAHLLFHRAAVLGGAYAQARLYIVIEIADRDTRHWPSLIMDREVLKLLYACNASKSAP